MNNFSFKDGKLSWDDQELFVGNGFNPTHAVKVDNLILVEFESTALKLDTATRKANIMCFDLSGTLLWISDQFCLENKPLKEFKFSKKFNSLVCENKTDPENSLVLDLSCGEIRHMTGYLYSKSFYCTSVGGSITKIYNLINIDQLMIETRTYLKSKFNNQEFKFAICIQNKWVYVCFESNDELKVQTPRNNILCFDNTQTPSLKWSLGFDKSVPSTHMAPTNQLLFSMDDGDNILLIHNTSNDTPPLSVDTDTGIVNGYYDFRSEKVVSFESK